MLVTGATGLLGRHIVASLAAMDAGELHAVSRTPPVAVLSGPVWHAADLLDPAAVQRLIDEVRPTHLLHAAWEATPVSYAASPENQRWLAAGIALLDAFGASGGRRYVGVGSSAEYAAS
ncbi:MAG: NAD-dependent epimerase/dehydratase family protein, partial [Beijerinckiaceae bacterium]